MISQVVSGSITFKFQEISFHHVVFEDSLCGLLIRRTEPGIIGTTQDVNSPISEVRSVIDESVILKRCNSGDSSVDCRLYLAVIDQPLSVVIYSKGRALDACSSLNLI